MPFGFRERLGGNHPAGRLPLLSPHAAHTNRRMLFATSSNPKIPGNIHQLDPLLRSRTAIKIARTPTMALSTDQRSSSRVVMTPPPNSRIVIYYSPGSLIPSSFREQPTTEARFPIRPLLQRFAVKLNHTTIASTLALAQEVSSEEQHTSVVTVANDRTNRSMRAKLIGHEPEQFGLLCAPPSAILLKARYEPVADRGTPPVLGNS
jgi:hypothetical protein